MLKKLGRDRCGSEPGCEWGMGERRGCNEGKDGRYSKTAKGSEYPVEEYH